MPRLSPFELAQAKPRPARNYYLLIFYLVFAVPLFAIHSTLLNLPYFWDELGQFVPTALDLLRHGQLVPTSTIPNVHPPGVEAYLVLFYKAFGYSIFVTRIAMLVMSSAGLLVLFLLAIQLSKGSKGAPAFLPPIFLLVSPLFYTQSMMAQLDMPAMVFTLLALLLFLKKRPAWAAGACTILVLCKETGLVVPAVFFCILCLRGRKREALYFLVPAVFVSAWLVWLHHVTGYWLGDPGFAHYNVDYSLHPVRMLLRALRRLFYLLCSEFRFVGTIVIAFTLKQLKILRSPDWTIVLAISAGTIVLVSVLGGAELERYLLPVLPLFYIVVSIALSYQRQWVSLAVTFLLIAGLLGNLYWNPPYPFPFENNLAMVDFVHLQETAAQVAEQSFGTKRIATAWPYSAALRRPDYGFVKKPLKVVETNDFRFSSIEKLSPAQFDVLIVYTRTWSPEHSVIALAPIREFLTRYYGWQPEISSEQCATLGLSEAVSWDSRGQRITIYVRQPTAS